MGRLMRDATDEQVAAYRAAADGIWHEVLKVVVLDAAHSLECSEPDCPGVVYPWVASKVTSHEEGVTFLSVILERMADIGVAGLLQLRAPTSARDDVVAAMAEAGMPRDVRAEGPPDA